MDAFPQNADRDSSQPLQTALQAGLAALKQKDYPTAIAHLQACQTSPDAATRLKAEMGLIKAYVGSAHHEAAIRLCQSLQNHPNAQVQAWVKQTLAELRSVIPPMGEANTAETTDVTGFVPLPSEPRTPTQPNPTGFVPHARRPPHTSPPQIAALPTPEPKARSTKRPQPPQARSSQPETTAPPPPSHSLWRNAGRSSKWSTLGAVDASGLWALQVGSVALLFWLLDTLTHWLLATWNSFSIWVYVLVGIPRLLLPTNLTSVIAVVLFGLVVASPWLLDAVLKRRYKLQAFSFADLEQSAPEAARLLKRVCGQRRHPLPTLHLLPSAAPFASTYGYLPQQSRMVVSQGLLDQLNDDEVAAILAGELAHLRYWDFGVMSALTLIAQLPYLIYWQVATWGNHQHDRVLQTVAVAVSTVAYGLFWLLRLPMLWLSRVRLYYSDRLAAELTGNPNGLTRALLKSAIGIAQDIQQQQQTSSLLESFEMLMPVGYRNALTIGSLYNGDPNLLNWDRLSPDTSWLILNNTHPPLGERCDLLRQYAQKWRLPSELNWNTSPSPSPSPKSKIQNPKSLHSRLLLQGAPFFGIPAGLMVAVLLWAVGWLSAQVGWAGFSWLAGDRSILVACGLLGFSIGMFLRINPFFPDIKRSNLAVEPDLASLLSEPQALPVDSTPMQLTGTLLGRRGFQNWLHQDLMLQTPTGSIRLHYTSRWGWIGDLLPKAIRPPALINRAVMVTGWFRRGATPWIDVETIQTQTGKTLRSHHPIWSTILASVAALLAVYIIFRGGS
jgi:Zn-dependent protease with chaperone function